MKRIINAHMALLNKTICHKTWRFRGCVVGTSFDFISLSVHLERFGVLVRYIKGEFSLRNAMQ